MSRLNPDYLLWRQFTQAECIALHESKLMKNFTSEQLARIQFTQSKTILPKVTALRVYSEVLGRPVTGDEPGLNNSTMLREYLQKSGAKMPTIEDDLLALIPEDKWHLVGAAPPDSNHLKKV